jgi:FkbM family methyltransferase
MRLHGVELIPDRDMVIRHYEQRGEFEPESMAAWLRACEPGAWGIDVGAYTGIYAIAAMRAGAMAIAVEPNPTAVKRLADNARANRTAVRIHPVAAGERRGGLPLYVRAPLSSANSMRQQPGQEITVPVVPLDDLAPAGRVAAIKIDAEGFECEVLRGARRIIETWHPLIITEALTDDSRAGQTEVMAGYGYFDSQPVDGRNLLWRWTA